MVMQRHFLDSQGRLIEVNCESCEYCLDWQTSGRKKRDLSDVLTFDNQQVKYSGGQI